MRPVVTSAPASAEELASPSKLDPRLIASLVAVYIIWSSTYLAMRIVVRDLPPMLSASLRFTIAGTVRLGYALKKGARIPRLADWLRVAPVGILLFVGGNGFV